MRRGGSRKAEEERTLLRRRRGGGEQNQAERSEHHSQTDHFANLRPPIDVEGIAPQLVQFTSPLLPLATLKSYKSHYDN
jgi:hypothetical protein